MAGIEYEAKALDVDPAMIARRIIGAGGVRRAETRLMRRYVYDTVPAVQGRWVRLRDTGGGTTLCVKQIATDAVDGTHETEVAVDSFEEAGELLGLIGLTPRGYQENRRTSYTLGEVRLEIDEWPGIPRTWRSRRTTQRRSGTPQPLSESTASGRRRSTRRRSTPCTASISTPSLTFASRRPVSAVPGRGTGLRPVRRGKPWTS